MYCLSAFTLIAAGLQLIGISAQQFPPVDQIPEQCKRPPPNIEKPQDCCTFPPLFSENDYKECNFQKFGAQKGPPQGPPDCGKHTCIIQRNNLTKSDGRIDNAAAGAYLDKWVAGTNDPQSFAEVVNIAKDRCLGNVQQAPNLPGACPPARFIMCSSSILFMKCPLNIWSNAGSCKQLRQYFDQCSDIMIRYF